MFCKVDETYQVHYEVIENVLPRDTLFVHGNIASNRWWIPTIEILKNRPTENHGRAILVEFRGCGKSTPPKSVEDAKMSRLSGDIIHLIETLKLNNLDLVGHSTGGLLVSMIAAQLPKKINRLVALDPVGPKGIKFDPSLEAAFEAMKVDRDLTATIIGSTIYNNDSQNSFFNEIVVEDAFHAAKTVGLFVLKNLDPFDITEDLKKIQCPSLFLHGEYDKLLPITETQKMSQLCPRGQFAQILGQGHCTNIENPRKFVEILIEFLSN